MRWSSLWSWPGISRQRRPTVEALRRWLQAGVEFMATKKGIAAALAMAAQGSPDLVAYSLDRLTRAAGELLQRAAAAGEIRADIDPEDLLRALVGVCCAYDGTAWQPQGPALDRCLRRWTTPPARQHDDLHLRQSVVALTAARAADARRSETVHLRAHLGIPAGIKKGHSWSMPTWNRRVEG